MFIAVQRGFGGKNCDKIFPIVAGNEQGNDYLYIIVRIFTADLSEPVFFFRGPNLTKPVKSPNYKPLF
jgi:hypothetical protein